MTSVETSVVCEGLRKTRLGRIHHEPFWYLNPARVQAIVAEVVQLNVREEVEIVDQQVSTKEESIKVAKPVSVESKPIASVETKFSVSSDQLAQIQLESASDHAIKVSVEQKQLELDRMWSASLEEKMAEIRLSPRKFDDISAALESVKVSPSSVAQLKEKLEAARQSRRPSNSNGQTIIPPAPKPIAQQLTTEELEKRQRDLTSLKSQLGEIDSTLNSVKGLMEKSLVGMDDSRIMRVAETLTQLQVKLNQLGSVVAQLERSADNTNISWLEEVKTVQTRLISTGKVTLQFKSATETLFAGLTPPKPPVVKEVPVESVRPTSSTTTTTTVVADSTLPSHLANRTTERCCQLLEKLSEIRLATEKSTEAIRTDPALKKLKFDLTKAVVSQLNTLSNESLTSVVGHMEEFFSGNPVPIDTQGRTISLQKHPKSMAFCFEALAKHVVKHAEDILAVHPESAYPLAALSVALWSKWNEFGLLLMAHIYDKFPQLLPLYPPQLEGYSDEDFYRAQGYKYVDGVVEKQDQFLKRLMGVSRLFAALSVVPVPPSVQRLGRSASGVKRVENPLGVGVIWSLLSTMANLPPIPDVTATILTEILTVGGHKLREKYRRQFEKLIVLFRLEFLPRIQVASTDPTSLASCSVLENRLREGHYSTPEGLVELQRYW